MKNMLNLFLTSTWAWNKINCLNSSFCAHSSHNLIQTSVGTPFFITDTVDTCYNEHIWSIKNRNTCLLIEYILVEYLSTSEPKGYFAVGNLETTIHSTTGYENYLSKDSNFITYSSFLLPHFSVSQMWNCSLFCFMDSDVFSSHLTNMILCSPSTPFSPQQLKWWS